MNNNEYNNQPQWDQNVDTNVDSIDKPESKPYYDNYTNESNHHSPPPSSYHGKVEYAEPQNTRRRRRKYDPYYHEPIHDQPSYYKDPLYRPPNAIVNNIYNPHGAYPMHPVVSNKSKTVSLLLCIFLGVLGVHRFYVGKIGTGLLYLFTGGLFGIGWFVDVVLIIAGRFRDYYGYPIVY